LGFGFRVSVLFLHFGGVGFNVEGRIWVSGSRSCGGFGVWGEAVRTPMAGAIHFENNCFAVMRSSSKEGSYLRLIDFCITQL
jgi:hypothetical protein